jgi:hypothetical protein
MPKLSKFGAGLIGMGLALACAFTAVQYANAADKGGKASAYDVAPTKSEPWTGPSVAIGTGWNVGMVSSGGPVGLAADGGSVSASVGYDKQWGSIVGGVGLGYSHFFGDLDTVGINSDIFAYSRLGVLVTPNALPYFHLGYGRMDTSAGDVDGWRLGPGMELKLPGTPFALDFKYSYGIHDVDKIAPGIEARSHTVGLNLVFRPFQ